MTKDEIIQMLFEASDMSPDTIPEKENDLVLFSMDELERFAALVAEKEREAIHDEWHSCVMSDLEHGVKCLNEKAAQDWHKNYPAMATMFPEWLEARSASYEASKGEQLLIGNTLFPSPDQVAEIVKRASKPHTASRKAKND